MLRIAIFVPNYSAGGTEKVASLLATGFKKYGVQVVLISLSNNKFPFPFGGSYETIDVNISSNWFVRYVLRQVKLFKICRLHNIDGILSMGEYPNFMVATLLMPKVERVNRYTNSSVSLVGFKGSLIKLFTKLAFVFSSHTVVPAQRLAQELSLPIGSKKLSVIPNPVDISSIYSRAEEFEDFTIDSSKYFIHVGQLVEQKNHVFLFQSYKNYLDAGGSYRLKIVGQGVLDKNLKLLSTELDLDEYIDFVGWIDNPYVLIKRAASLLLTSKWEGIPNVMLEAMALGVPIISVDCPTGPREVLEDGKHGLLLPMGDHAAFSSALQQIENNENGFASALSNSSQLRASSFDVEQISKRFIELFN